MIWVDKAADNSFFFSYPNSTTRFGCRQVLVRQISGSVVVSAVMAAIAGDMLPCTGMCCGATSRPAQRNAGQQRRAECRDQPIYPASKLVFGRGHRSARVEARTAKSAERCRGEHFRRGSGGLCIRLRSGLGGHTANNGGSVRGVVTVVEDEPDIGTVRMDSGSGVSRGVIPVRKFGSVDVE
jgi:hypothetical protein